MLLAETVRYPALGLVAATTASLFWAFSVVMHRRIGRIMPPVRLNATKVVYAATVLGLVVLVQWYYGVMPWKMPSTQIALMALSGIIGIAVGDTMFYAGLNRMGARRILLLYTISPVITILIAWAFLHEPLTPMQIIGIAVTCGGVAWVIAERNKGKADGHVDLLGILFGIGSATCQAVGYLISHSLLKQYDMTPVASAFLRIASCVPLLIAFLWLDRILSDSGGEDHNHPAKPSRRQAMIMFFIAVSLGTIGGIYLMQFSATHATKAGVAMTLLSITPIFVLPITAFLGEHISIRAIFGAFVAIAGVAMLYVFSG